MGMDDRVIAQDRVLADADIDLKEIVMGLHRDVQQDGVTVSADLDAVCVLFGKQRRVLEVIHPGHPRNSDGSVVHTGDSRTGAREWDNERIFVFLDALPAAVSALIFIGGTGSRGFIEVLGASCHVSDHATEREWVRLDLTALDGARTLRCPPFTAARRAGACPRTRTTDGSLLADLLILVANGKSGEPKNGN